MAIGGGTGVVSHQHLGRCETRRSLKHNAQVGQTFVMNDPVSMKWMAFLRKTTKVILCTSSQHILSRVLPKHIYSDKNT